MTIKDLACIYLDDLGYTQVETEAVINREGGIWLNLKGLVDVRDKINVILGEKAKETIPDPNLLIDYLKEQAAEQAQAYIFPCECEQVVKAFENWLFERSTVIILNWSSKKDFILNECRSTRPVIGATISKGKGLLETMKNAVNPPASLT